MVFFKKKKQQPKQTKEPEKWEQLGMTKERYDNLMNVIYGMSDEEMDYRIKTAGQHRLYNPYAPQVTDDTPDQDDEKYDVLYQQTLTNIRKEKSISSTETKSQTVVHSTASTSSALPDEAELEKALKNLDNMVGLANVKKMIHEIVDDVKLRKKREAIGQYMPNQSLNMIFAGNPGTGKTTVAKMVGQIMKSLNVLEKGHFVSATRDKLVVEHIGGTAKQTKKVLEEALGGVLFIYEAYSLARGNETDFGREAIDTLVEFMEDHKGEILIILAGYEKELEMLWKVNSGLKSRFPNIIHFPDYTTEEMVELMKVQAKQYKVRLTNETERLLHDFFDRKQINGRTDNGNGRLVRNEIEAAIRRQSRRLQKKENPTKEEFVFLLPSDFELKKQKTFNLEQELNQIVGNEHIKEHIRRLQAQVKIQKIRKEQGLSTTGQSLHMIFTGNPGTGKTTIARLVGKILKELGVCKKGHVVEVGRSDLVGQYVGQTAPKMKEKIQEALGGILFIDEAYTLARGGKNDFGKEAVDTLVQEMENHRDELIVILAGYTREMNEFLNLNPGLKSRFPYLFKFKDYNERELIELFFRMAKQDDYKIDKKAIGILRYLANDAIEKKAKDTGNGRYVRNTLEKAKQHQAMRLSKLDRRPTQEELRLLTDRDFFLVLPFKQLKR